MESFYSDDSKLSNKRSLPMRAMIEIINGELSIYPVARNDLEERRILEELRFFQEAWAEK